MSSFAGGKSSKSSLTLSSASGTAVQSNRSSSNRNNVGREQEEEIIVQLLARRSSHLPGNTWFQDWDQWFRNNHIVFGICFHHPLHPLETWERLVALIGSVAFGLFTTNVAYLWDESHRDVRDDAVLTVWLTDTSFVLTKGLIVLWTVGGVCHSVWDFIVWHIMACACCHPGGRWGENPGSRRYKDCGSFLLIPVVAAVVALACVVVLIRASHVNIDKKYDDYGNGNGNDNNNNGGDDDVDMSIDTTNITDVRQFSFLAEYAIELGLAWLVYFPVIGTVLFSGCLGCGRLPILGGRPRDKRLVDQASEGDGPWYALWGGLPPFSGTTKGRL